MAEKESKTIKVSPGSELAVLIKDAEVSGEPVLVDIGEAVYPLYVGTTGEPTVADRWRGPRPEDVARSREAILSSAGGWKGLVDGEELKERLRSERGSDRPPAQL